MSNGRPTGSVPQVPDWKGQAAGWAMQHVTKVGVIGGGFCVLAAFAKAIIHKDVDGFLNATMYLGLLLIGAGAAFGAKKGNDLAVDIAADAAVDRSRIANALGVPGVGSTTVAPVARELEKRNS